MLGFSRSSMNKTYQKNAQDSLQATACETFFNDETQTHASRFFGQDSYRHQPKTKVKAETALSKAHTLIDTLLDDIDDKKRFNNSVVTNVKNTNISVLQDYHTWKEENEILQKQNASRRHRKNSRIPWGQQQVQATDCYGSRVERKTTRVYEDNEDQDLNQSQMLKKIIQQQQINNLNLSRKCEFLEAENQFLKQSGDSTMMKSISPKHSVINDNLWNQLQELKQENYQLKQDTLRLLKNIR